MGRRKTYQRKEMLVCAMNAFWDKGYHATSLADLVAATGLNKNTLYTEFDSKQHLFHAALQLYTDMGVQQSQSYLEREPRGIKNIRDYFCSMSYEENCRGCLMTMTINQKNLVTSNSMDVVRKAIQRIENMLHDNLLAAYNAGQVKSKKECQRLAAFFLFSIQGITTMGKYEGDQRKLDLVVESILSVLDGALNPNV